MTSSRWRAALDDLWKLNRVHAGPEMTRAYELLAGHYDVELIRFPSGEDCGSWTSPPEWQARTGRLTGPDGEVVADVADHVLHLYPYSPPFSGTVTLDELQPHLMSNPNRPDAIPFFYRNQYRHWDTEWGFAIPHAVRENLKPGDYTVEIDTAFTPGWMYMAEQVCNGEHPDSVLMVGHFDHPAMCNDGLVGCLAMHEVITRLNAAGRKTRLTYRSLSTVEIVGSVFYARHRAPANKVREATFVGIAGADAPVRYQTSALGESVMDRAMAHLLHPDWNDDTSINPFRDSNGIGNDEIAFDVVGVDIPCGSTVRWRMSEYHLSTDTPDTVYDDRFEEFVSVLMQLVDVYEKNARLIARFDSLPCVSKPEFDLYVGRLRMSGIDQPMDENARALLVRLGNPLDRAQAIRVGERFNQMCNYLPVMANGRFTTLDFAERIGVPFALADAYTDMWVEKGLLEKVWLHPWDDTDD